MKLNLIDLGCVLMLLLPVPKLVLLVFKFSACGEVFF
jgi:hypothetical protein